MNWEPKINYFGKQSNFILRGDGFKISYNPDTQSSTIIDCFSGDKNADGSYQETALLYKGNFYILNGDFRKEYEELVPKGYQACYDFFLSKSEFKSSWSN